ncbi:MAG TPA: hypothetical protein ENJ87_09645 [Gammaproteobacteria bacterium]|nr:hypothetical protein [Gammaproteobacteria bacterium]
MNSMFKILQRHAAIAPTDSEEITDPARIARLLEQLSKHYSPLTVQIQGHKVQYTSCIVGVDRPYVLLDEFIPATGHERLLDSGKVFITGKLEGVDFSFNTTLHHVDKSDDMLTYYMKLPLRLRYRQRRMAYRVRIPATQQLYVLVDDGSDRILRGELRDLSHGGAGEIISDQKSNLKIGQKYECAIELPCREWLYCTVEMRYLKDIPSRNRQIIGACFDALTRVQSRLIARCVSELELEQLKKRATFR